MEITFLEIWLMKKQMVKENKGSYYIRNFVNDKKEGLEHFFGIKIFIMKITGKMISKKKMENIIIKVI